MPKYNVELEFWEFVDNIEAENEQEAIKNALIKLIIGSIFTSLLPHHFL